MDHGVMSNYLKNKLLICSHFSYTVFPSMPLTEQSGNKTVAKQLTCARIWLTKVHSLSRQSIKYTCIKKTPELRPETQC